MALTKRTYSDGNTVITAKNLNEIQDEVIANGNGKVSKSGDTMTGTLYRESTGQANGVIQRLMDADITTAPSEHKYGKYTVSDANGNQVAQFRGGILSDQRTIVSLIAQRPSNGSNVQNVLSLYTKSDGTTPVYVSNAPAWREAINAVNKSGDTMSGSFTINGTLTANGLTGRALELKPITDTANGGFIDFHYGGSTAGYTSRIIEDVSGRIRIYASNGVRLSVPLEIASGGTGQTEVTQTTTISAIASAGSNTTITTASFTQWGKVAMITIGFSRSINTGINTDITIATLVSGKRPKTTAPVNVRYNAANVFAYVTADGNVKINTSASIPSGTAIYLNATYILP